MYMNKELQDSLEKSGKSFVQNIANAKDSGIMSPFSAFPEDAKVVGQDKHEEIILIIRQHPITYLPQFISAVVIFIFAFILPGIVGAALNSGVAGALTFIMTLSYLILFITDTFVRWYYTVNIITTQRFIDLDYNGISKHDVADGQIENIQDVSHNVVGFWGLPFDYGNVYIQTAAEKSKFEFLSVPRPRDIQDTLFDLVELKQAGEI